MSRGTSEAFFDVVEWAADQPWSTGKVGLLGISYFAGSQWRVAAQQPRGLSAIVPWEGMSDYYRDRCRHGGILSNEFIKFWWDRQIVSNQYGKGGRAARNWGPDTIEGDLGEDELKANRQDQNIDNAANQFRDQAYYASKEYNKEDIVVPLLSVANWGGILLHLRGNVEGYTLAGSQLKYLRFITGRHDLPFYYKEEVEIQKSFLDAFLKDEDRVGWSIPGKLPPVDIVLRKGDVGHNDAAAEMVYSRRTEMEWPIARTQYIPYYLTPTLGLCPEKPEATAISKVTYIATGFQHDDGREIGAVSQGWKPLVDTFDLEHQVSFTTAPFEVETEMTGHITAHLNVSVSPTIPGISPNEIDLFVTLRHFSSAGKEVFYTGTAGNPVPLCKGWLRTSLRKVNTTHLNHREWLPHRDYFSSDVLPVLPGEVYPVDIEIWPTNVVLDPGSKLVFEVSSGDTQGCERFKHTSPVDR